MFPLKNVVDMYFIPSIHCKTAIRIYNNHRLTQLTYYYGRLSLLQSTIRSYIHFFSTWFFYFTMSLLQFHYAPLLLLHSTQFTLWIFVSFPSLCYYCYCLSTLCIFYTFLYIWISETLSLFLLHVYKCECMPL